MIEDATRELGKPADWNTVRDGRCQSLPIRDGTINGVPVMTSAWIPTAAELERLRHGKCIYLTIWGGAHPPVNLSVEE